MCRSNFRAEVRRIQGLAAATEQRAHNIRVKPGAILHRILVSLLPNTHQTPSSRLCPSIRSAPNKSEVSTPYGVVAEAHRSHLRVPRYETRFFISLHSLLSVGSAACSQPFAESGIINQSSRSTLPRSPWRHISSPTSNLEFFSYADREILFASSGSSWSPRGNSVLSNTVYQHLPAY